MRREELPPHDRRRGRIGFARRRGEPGFGAGRATGGAGARRWLLALAALPALYLHEAFLFLGPVLALASAWRAGCETEKERRIIYAGLGIWFLLIAGMEIGYIVDAPDPDNRDNFFLVTLSLGFLVDPAGGFGHGGVNVPALMGVMAAATAWLAGRAPERASVIVAGFAVLCTSLVAASAL